MATQQARNLTYGKSSAIGKDPFDGLLKKAFNNQGVDINLQKEYLKRINDIYFEDPQFLIGKNPEYITYALRYGSRLRNRAIDSSDLNRLISAEMPGEKKEKVFTVIRYILWLREMEGQLISKDLVPTDWYEETEKTRRLMSRSKYQTIASLEDEGD